MTGVSTFRQRKVCVSRVRLYRQIERRAELGSDMNELYAISLIKNGGIKNVKPLDRDI